MEEEEKEVGRNKGKQKEIFLDSSSSVTFSSVKHPISAEKLRNCHAAVSHSTAFNLRIFLAPISLKKISRMKSHSRDLFWTESFKPVYFTRLITSLQNARNVLDCWVGATIEREREREKDFGTWLPRNDRFNELLDFAAVYRGRGLSTTIHVPFHISLYPSETEDDRG